MGEWEREGVRRVLGIAGESMGRGKGENKRGVKGGRGERG